MTNIADYELVEHDQFRHDAEHHHRDDEESLSEPELNQAKNIPSEPTPPGSDPPAGDENPGLAAAKALGTGLVFMVAAPVFFGLATAGGVVYGAAKVLEGVGKGLAAGPEAVYDAYMKDDNDHDEGKAKPSGDGKA